MSRIKRWRYITWKKVESKMAPRGKFVLADRLRCLSHAISTTLAYTNLFCVVPSRLSLNFSSSRSLASVSSTASVAPLIGPARNIQKGKRYKHVTLMQGFPTWGSGPGTLGGSRGLQKGVAKTNERIKIIFFSIREGEIIIKIPLIISQISKLSSWSWSRWVLGGRRIFSI